jgi:hypothetical protein
MSYWQKQYEAYIAQWPRMAAEYRKFPAWFKCDCAGAMKLWVERGLVKEKR